MTTMTVWHHARILEPDVPAIMARPRPMIPDDFAAQAPATLLATIASRLPDAVALIGYGQTLTFRALRDRAERWARVLAKTPPGPIAVTLPHTPEATAAILGGLITARPLLIIDPHWPKARIDDLLERAGPHTRLLPDARATHELGLSAIDAEPSDDRWSPPWPHDPDGPATVFFTSGSTGRPKGIVTSMFGNLTRARITVNAWRMGPGDRMLNTSAASTHSSFCRMLASVMSGATLVHFTTATDGLTALLRRMTEDRVNLMVATPAVLRTLLTLPRFSAAASDLRLLLSAADSLLSTDISQARAALPADCVIDHSYASTEAGIVARWSVRDSPTDSVARVPAGYLPSDLEHSFTADSALVVRGRSVALGEWEDGRVVPGRMTSDPDHPNWRVFNTGDLTEMGDDGLLRFIARGDRQLNLNGVRIEPAEIEAVLRAEPDVTDAAVIGHSLGERSVLVAFVVSDRAAEVLTAALRKRATENLPATSRPSRFVVLPAFPRLPSGKLDFQAFTRLA